MGIKYVRESNYLDLNIGSLLHPTVRLCVRGSEADNIDEEYLAKKSDEPQKSATQHAVSIIFLGAGLLTSYGAWGYLQEKIMTTSYVDSLGNKAMYKNSQFLVFVNRILAFIIAITVMLFIRQPKHKAPLYKYSFCSFSNIMSSWCQYEALKFVSFPTQVLAKARLPEAMIKATSIVISSDSDESDSDDNRSRSKHKKDKNKKKKKEKKKHKDHKKKHKHKEKKKKDKY